MEEQEFSGWCKGCGFRPAIDSAGLCSECADTLVMLMDEFDAAEERELS